MAVTDERIDRFLDTAVMTAPDLRTERGGMTDRVTLILGGRAVFNSSVEHCREALLRLMAAPAALGALTGAASAQLGEITDADPAQRTMMAVGILAECWPQVVMDGWLARDRRSPSPVSVTADATLSLRLHGGFGHRVLWDEGLAQPAGLQAEVYDREYFEGGRHGVGYGDYSAQPWRIEKSKRQARQARALLEFHGLPTDRLRVLDVGCGYGDFLHACADSHGWVGMGVDVSDHAVMKAGTHPNVTAVVGQLNAVPSGQGYDLIVMNDLIEHHPDPGALLVAAAGMLTATGSVLIRTPNIQAAEYVVFGPDYHSVKREHLHYFTVASLAAAAAASDLALTWHRTTSHLLQGWVGAAGCAFLAATDQGSDIEAMLRPARSH